MMNKSQIAILRSVYEEGARDKVARRDWEGWTCNCNSIRTLDMVTEGFDKPGYVDPSEAIPFFPKETTGLNV